MHNKVWLFGLLLLLAVQQAHANFRKAVDAYIAHDGASVLKEVNDAVDSKDNDGLALFLSALNIDATTSRQKDIARIWGGNSAKHFLDETQVKTTLSVLFTEQKQNELFTALKAAVDNSSPDIQYNFALVAMNVLNKSQRKDWLKVRQEFANKGSYIAKLQSTNDLVAQAELGDSRSQFNLGFKYMNFGNDWGYGCQKESTEVICRAKDEEKGFYWLKQALKGYDQQRFISHEEGFDGLALYADSMCDFFQSTANGNAHTLRQAYLWCVMGINSGGGSSWGLLNKLNQSGNLKIAAPEIDAIWGMSIQQDRDRLAKTLNLTEFAKSPEWMVELRKEQLKKDTPIFSYYYSDYRLTPYLLDIYPDGRVNITFNFLPETNGDLLMKVSNKTIQNFLGDLNKLDFKNWTLFTTSGQFCDNFDPCIWTDVKVTYRQGKSLRKVVIREPAYLAEYNYNDPKTRRSLSTLRVAKLNALMERYFPTQDIRCKLGNSDGFKESCIARDSRWASLAKEPYAKN